METIRIAAFQACMTGLIICTASSLVQEEKFASQLKVIFSAFFIISLVIPLKNEIPDIFSAETAAVCEYDGAENAFDEEMEKYIKSNTEKALKEKFTEQGMVFDDLEAEISIDDEYKVTLVSVNVITSNKKAAENILKKELGNDVKIIVKDRRKE